MTSFVQEIHDDIEHATQYCDIRDLLAAWTSRANEGPVELAPLLAAFAEMSDRLMVLVDEGEDLVYRQVGHMVAALFGHDPTDRPLRELDNPGVKLFNHRYRRILASGKPSFCILHRFGPSAMGVSERLILPVEDQGRPALLVYLRCRETENELLSSVFHASSDAITVMEAVRDGNNEIVDFRIVAANAESGRRLRLEPTALIGRPFLEIWPFAKEIGAFVRFARAVNEQRGEVFDTRYPVHGSIVERQLRIVPFGECLTVTNVDIGPTLTASRAIEKQRNELFTANTLLECRALELKSSNDALEQTTRELREEIRRNRVLESELVYLARHDGLTGLPNRSYFETQFDEALAKAGSKHVALCFIDVDHFKEINDRFGHSAGDSALREVAQRLAQTLRATDVVGRMGGDEFAALITDLPDDAAARSAVRRMLAAGMAPFTVNQQDVPISMSIGVAVYPTDGETVRELMIAADMAVYRAKRDGRGRSVFFEPALRQQAEHLYRLIGRLARAIDIGEIRPYYQPLLDLRTGQLIGFEALARWFHPERGMLTPSTFADALEIPDIAFALTRAMIDRVIDDIAHWSRLGLPAHVSVNVTGFDLKRPDFAADVLAKLSRRGLSSRQLAIEVTETTVLSRDSGRVAETIAELRRLGFSVALDDFGTGFASMSHLLRLPVDSLKIDRSFVADIETSSRTAAVVRTLVSLASALDLVVVAEGVETRQQLDLLRGFGCQVVQGFLLAEPMPADEVPGFIESFALPDANRPPRIRSVG
ncbi:MAG: EAL domain-containing protein [Rhizobiales bacterium]|nr:EAL domain-containing protein [Hyphomicrobiales bacterium]